jgi:hypothetical protein
MRTWILCLCLTALTWIATGASAQVGNGMPRVMGTADYTQGWLPQMDMPNGVQLMTDQSWAAFRSSGRDPWKIVWDDAKLDLVVQRARLHNAAIAVDLESINIRVDRASPQRVAAGITRLKEVIDELKARAPDLQVGLWLPTAEHDLVYLEMKRIGAPVPVSAAKIAAVQNWLEQQRSLLESSGLVDACDFIVVRGYVDYDNKSWGYYRSIAAGQARAWMPMGKPTWIAVCPRYVSSRVPSYKLPVQSEQWRELLEGLLESGAGVTIFDFNQIPIDDVRQNVNVLLWKFATAGQLAATPPNAAAPNFVRQPAYIPPAVASASGSKTPTGGTTSTRTTTNRIQPVGAKPTK